MIPTPAFFYGLTSGEEIAVEIEPGKRLIIKYLTTGEAREDRERGDLAPFLDRGEIANRQVGAGSNVRQREVKLEPALSKAGADPRAE